MSTNEELNRDTAPADSNTDETRSENRESVADRANAANSTDRAEGTAAEDGGPHPENPDHRGAHLEGQYNKEEGRYNKDAGEGLQHK